MSTPIPRHISERDTTADLTFELTQDDYAEKGKESAVLAQEVGKLNGELADIKAKFKAKIDGKNEELQSVLATIRAGKEVRNVKCIERRNYDKFTVEHIFDGKVMAIRDMTHMERQTTMDLEVKARRRNAEEAKKVKSIFDKSKKQTPEEKSQNDIRDAIRQETSSKTKRDMLT